jgi:hypothetical protein
MNKFILICVFTQIFQLLAQDHELHNKNHRHISLAPVSIMGDHSHPKGEWMFSYRSMSMLMDENYENSSAISTSSIFNSGFMVAPTKMKMQMHMMGLMKAYSDISTLMIMIPYKELEMDHINRLGKTFSTKTSGIGDIKLTWIKDLKPKQDFELLFKLGMSFPTGSVDERGDTLVSNAKLPYPMQLGSGSFSLLPGLTFSKEVSRFILASQFNGTLRIDDNDQNYRLGNIYQFNNWLTVKWNPSFSSSLLLKWEKTVDIKGRDSQLNAKMVPTADPKNLGGDRLDIGLGIKFTPCHGTLLNHIIGLEYQLPIRQNLNGPQLAIDSIFHVAWSYIW